MSDSSRLRPQPAQPTTATMRSRVGHSTSLRSLGAALVVAVATLTSCGSSQDPPVRASRQPVGGVKVPEGGASPAWVSIEWEDVDVHGVYPAYGTFGLLLRNNTAEWAYVTLRMTSFGLETRQAARDLGAVWVPPSEVNYVPVNLDSFPIRSIGSPSSVHVDAEVQVGRDRRFSASSRLAYEYAPDMWSVTLWGATAKRFDLHHPDDPRLESLRMSELNFSLSNPQGDVWDEWFQEYLPVWWLPPVGGRYYQVWGAADFWEDWPASLPGPGTEQIPPIPPAGTPSTRVCNSHVYKFLDADAGGDYFTLTGYNPAPSRYAAGTLQNLDTGESYWGGWLDADGCTPNLLLPAGTYALTVGSQLKKGQVSIDVKAEQNYDIQEPPPNVPVIGYVRAIFTRYASTEPETVVVGTYLTQSAANTMVVSARMLDAPDNGLTEGHITVSTRHPSTYAIDCWDGFNEAPISYAATSFLDKTSYVCLGRKDMLQQSDTWYKFVIGHEFGHVAQGFGMGNLTTSYDNQTSQPLCRCDHVEGGNQIHCIQSQEYVGAGASEGFAHAYASRILNRPTDPDCAFGYYKEFKDTNLVLHEPPVTIDCKAQVRWLENHCVAADRGVEYDWLGFLYDVNTAPAAQKTAMTDLWSIYLGACTPPDCEQEDVKWSPFLAAAQAYYGPTDLRYARIVNSGNDFGVDH